MPETSYNPSEKKKQSHIKREDELSKWSKPHLGKGIRTAGKREESVQARTRAMPSFAAVLTPLRRGPMGYPCRSKRAILLVSARSFGNKRGELHEQRTPYKLEEKEGKIKKIRGNVQERS